MLAFMVTCFGGCKEKNTSVSTESQNSYIQIQMDEAIMIEAEDFGKCFSTEDQTEGMTAFMERREKNFQNK